MFLYSDSFDFSLFGLDFSIQYYALCLIGGAIVAYLVSRYFAEKNYKKGYLIDNMFIPCFLSGIVGARIWFVISEWSYYMSNPSEIIKVWHGGIAIQGGIIAGAIAGILMVYFDHKKNPDELTPKESIFRYMDLILPNVLIAQVIGRWGNFFNVEVYGSCVSTSKLWFLPNFIIKRLQTNNYGMPLCQVGQAVQPLFFYEGVLNFIGFIIISFLLRYLWKNRKHGVLGFLYIAYYGVVRIVLEPLREEEYIMRIGSISQSVLMSAIFIIVGLAGIIWIYWEEIKNLFNKIFRKKVKNNE